QRVSLPNPETAVAVIGVDRLLDDPVALRALPVGDRVTAQRAPERRGHFLRKRACRLRRGSLTENVENRLVDGGTEMGHLRSNYRAVTIRRSGVHVRTCAIGYS